MKRTNSRRAAAASVALVAAITLAACGGSGDDTGGGDEESGGGTLVFGDTSEPDTLFPWKATQFQAINVVQNLYSTLTELNEGLEVVPGVAEEWQVSEDGLTVTFTLREGVTFADGSALDSADVKASLDRIKDPATTAVAAATLATVTAVEAPDPQTVVLTLSAPDAGLLSGLASINMAIIAEEDSEETLMTEANGSGPFVLGERVPGESLTLDANADYWGDVPAIDAVEFRVIPDETSIVSALQSGDVHMAVFDDPLVAETAEIGDVSVVKTPQLSYHVLQLNGAVAPFDNLDVRLAIQCAIDRQEVLDTAALGEGEITGPITSPAFKSDPNDPERPCGEQDQQEARNHLAAAGYDDANPLTFSAIVSEGEYATSVAEAENVAAQLAEVGITMEIEKMPIADFVTRWLAPDFTAAIALNGGRPDADGMYGRYFTSTGNLNKVAGYSSEELDALFAQGRAEQDPEKRKDIYAEISTLLEQNAPWIWLFTSYTYTASTNTVGGFIPMANGSVQGLRDVTLD